MATMTFLAEQTGFYSGAPLSQGQTITLCQQLESMIRELQGQSAALRQDLTNTEDNVFQLRTGLTSTNASVQGLQEGFTSTSNNLDLMKKDFGRAVNKVNKLGTSMESAVEVCNNLRESNKKLFSEVALLRQGHAGLIQQINGVASLADTTKTHITHDLSEQLNIANACIKGLKEDLERTKSGVSELREGFRCSNQKLQGLHDDLTKANMFASSLDQRLNETGTQLKGARQNLSETSSVALKNHEDHKLTKKTLHSTQEAVKKCGFHVRMVNETLDAAIQKLDSTSDTAQKNGSVLSQFKDVLDKTRNEVRSLKEDYMVISETTMFLKTTLHDTEATVKCVQASLQETNSMVLPNLCLDNGARPWSTCSDRCGRKSAMSRMSPKTNRSVYSPIQSQSPDFENGDSFMFP